MYHVVEILNLFPLPSLPTQLRAFNLISLTKVGYYYRSGECSVPPGTEEIDGFGCVNARETPKRPFAPAARAHCLPPGIHSDYQSGYWYSAPVIHMQTYLRWLRFHLHAHGVVFLDHVAVRNLAAPFPPEFLLPPSFRITVVVNCSGLGSARLCNDDSMFPVRGALVLVKVISTHPFWHSTIESWTSFSPYPRARDC